MIQWFFGLAQIWVVSASQIIVRTWRCSVKVGDLVRGSKDNLEIQQNSIALIVAKDHPVGAIGRFSIIWIGGEIKSTRILHNFRPEELEVISEGG
jgi:hypothetical protein